MHIKLHSSNNPIVYVICLYKFEKANKPDSQTARQPASQTASQTARQPASQTARQPDSQTARQPERQTMNHHYYRHYHRCRLLSASSHRYQPQHGSRAAVRVLVILGVRGVRLLAGARRGSRRCRRGPALRRRSLGDRKVLASATLPQQGGPERGDPTKKSLQSHV